MVSMVMFWGLKCDEIRSSSNFFVCLKFGVLTLSVISSSLKTLISFIWQTSSHDRYSYSCSLTTLVYFWSAWRSWLLCDYFFSTLYDMVDRVISRLLRIFDMLPLAIAVFYYNDRVSSICMFWSSSDCLEYFENFFLTASFKKLYKPFLIVDFSFFISDFSGTLKDLNEF